NTELALSEAEVKAMPTMESETKNKDGVASTYTGVSLKALLEKAGLKADAAKVDFVADDGFTAEATVAEVQGCDKCIVSFREKGGFRMVMPDMSNKLQVKGGVEIQVQ